MSNCISCPKINKKAVAETLFLNVMQVTDQQSGRTLAVERVDSNSMVGCRIDGPECDWVVLFRRDSRRSAGPISLELSGEQTCRILITDLEPGTWEAKRDGGGGISLRVSNETGAAWLTGAAGNWHISRTGGG